ncbi:hypothetical protein VTL71DRAFT_5135 [Oculimacula yallundae]|uniref:SprT-like domain-containing protein n=1 Tax=Oculimacula yallundae TaxID=86028 RepID=A0ABR4C090_9HELO
MAALLRGSSSPDHNIKTSSRRRHNVRVQTSDSRPSRRSHRESQQHYIKQRTSSPRERWSTPSPMMTTTTTTMNFPSPIPLEAAHSITMERTASGRSIISHSSYESTYEQAPAPSSQSTFSDPDKAAASRVKHHVNKISSQRKYERHERILRSLIGRDQPLDDGRIIDDVALDSILNSANAIFFSGVLSGRVQWEWSSQSRYHDELIGTTALRRRAGNDGFETLIVLSEPILRSDRYDRRLLLSAFLHELIHCYLFIVCGFEAKRERGHTKGFHVIAEVIDRWVGEGAEGCRWLRLCNMKANLNNFRRDVGGRNLVMGRELEESMEIMDPRMDMAMSMSRGERRLEHGHEGCNQSPRPHGGLLIEAPTLRMVYL